MSYDHTRQLSPAISEDRLYRAHRAWILFVQGLFRVQPKGGYRWSPNLDETEIIISAGEITLGRESNQRPRITVVRGPAQFLSLSMSQVIPMEFINSEHQIVSDLIGSSISITATAKEGLVAQSLAYYVARLIPAFRGPLVRLGAMHDVGNNIQIGAETPHGSMVKGSVVPEWKSVQVSTSFHIQEEVVVTPEYFDPIMQAVTIHMESNGQAAQDQTFTASVT